MSRLSEKDTQSLMEQAAPYYLPEGYHVGPHRLDVRDGAQRLADTARAHGIRVDGEVVVLASTWHDAGTAILPADFYIREGDTWRPARHSEEVATQLFTNAAERVGAPRSLIRAVGHVIMGTNPLEPLRTAEAKVVAAADVHGVGFDPFDQFISVTRTLWHEAVWRHAKDITWSDFVKGSMGYLGLFVRRDIRLTGNYYDELGRSAWHTGALDNISGLAGEAWEAHRTTGLWMPSKHNNLSNFQVAYQPDSGENPIVVSLPELGDVVSIADDALDELHVSADLLCSRRVAREAGRILKDNGLLLVR